MKKILLYIIDWAIVNGQRPVDLVNPLVDSANSRWFFSSLPSIWNGEFKS